MLLNTIGTVNVVCCRRTTTVLEAARLMRDHHVGDLVVVDDPDEDRIAVGLVTDRDLAVEVLAQGLNAAKTTVGSFLRTPVVVARDTEDLSAALERMRVNGVRRLPIVDGTERVVGVITLDDLLRLNASNATAIADIVGRGRHHEEHARR
jgi:CBS domain-containing protein